jgi:rhamnosyltransferase
MTTLACANDRAGPTVAVVTAYRPEPGLFDRFIGVRDACRAVIIVDNTPGGHRFEPLPAGFETLQDGTNKGLGHALNLGIARARELGAGAVVLFDQDSTPEPDFVPRMRRALESAEAETGRPCCIGPVHVDDRHNGSDRPGVRPRTMSIEVTCLPTSGMVFSPWALGTGDDFSDEFFLDLADFDWCWRLRRKGWAIRRTPDVQMRHRLGLAERRWCGLTFYVPAPYRHYFQVRDTLRLCMHAYVPLYSRLRLMSVLPLKALVYPFLLDRGAERLRWMLLGVRDAWRGVGGAGAAFERLCR